MEDVQTRSDPDTIVKFDTFSQAALKKMARTLGLKAPVEARSEYLEAVASLLGTPQHREALERRLTPSQWDLLNLLPVRSGLFRLRVLVLAAEERGEAGDDRLRDALALLAHGCLSPVGQPMGINRIGIDKSSLTSIGLNVVLEVVPAVAAWAREHLRPKNALPVNEPPRGIVASALPEFQRAAFVVLAEARRKPVRMTREGQPYKADMRNLAAALAGPSGGKRRSGSEPVPPVLWFALSVLSGAGLLVEHDDSLRPAAKADEFFSARPQHQVQTLLDGWYQSAFKEFLFIPSLEFGFGWGYTAEDTPWFKREEDHYGPRRAGVGVARRCIVAAMTEGAAAAPDAWHPIADVARTVFADYPEMLFPRIDDYGYYGVSYFNRPQGRRAYTAVHRKDAGHGTTRQDIAARTLYQDTDWMEVEGGFVQEVIAGPMRWLGLAEVGPDGGAADRFRLTDLGRHLLCGAPLPEVEAAQAGKRAVVQPDYEVVVLDVTRGLDLLAQLDAFAERRTLDRAATYRLTQPALARGLDRGWTGKRVLTALEAANDGPLPQNVRYSLEEWIRLYESLSLHEASCLLEADSPAQLDAWLADPRVAKLLGERLGPTVMRVPEGSVDQLLELLNPPAEQSWVVDYAEKPAGVVELRDPDLIELATDQAEPYLRYRLEAFADPAGESETGIAYRITRASVQRAVELGLRHPQMRDFLSTAANGVLPPDLAVRLCGWSRIVPAPQAEALVAVALPRLPVAWETLRHIPEIGGLIRALPTPELALVAPEDLEALQAELDERGLNLRMATLSEEQLRDQQQPSPYPAAPAAGPAPVLLVSDLSAFDGLDDDFELDAGDMQSVLSELRFLGRTRRTMKPRRDR